MSFDIFLYAFKGAELTVFPRSIVEKALGPLRPFVLSLGRFDAPLVTLNRQFKMKFSNSATLYMDEGPEVNGFTVNRPPDLPEFWQGIFEVLQQTPSVLHWPGDSCVVARPEVIWELPTVMVEALGCPIVVKGPLEIMPVIERS